MTYKITQIILLFCGILCSSCYLQDKNSMYTCLNNYHIEGASPNRAGEYLESFNFSERKFSEDQEVKSGQKSLFSRGSLPCAVQVVPRTIKPTQICPLLRGGSY